MTGGSISQLNHRRWLKLELGIEDDSRLKDTTLGVEGQV